MREVLGTADDGGRLDMRALEKTVWLAAVSLVATFPTGCGSGQPAPLPVSVSISPLSVQSIDQGQSASFAASVANDVANKGVSWAVSGTNCAGTMCGTLSSQTTIGVTYTAPTAVSANLSAKITATSITDGRKTAFAAVTVVPPPTIKPTSLPNGVAGDPYSATLQEAGGVAPYSWFVSGGVLPQGLSLNADGTISGTPAVGGKFSFTAQITDSGTPQLTEGIDMNLTVTVLPLSVSTTAL